MVSPARLHLIKSKVETEFPNLRTTPYRIASPSDRRYNCIAWAAGDDRRWWWPVSRPRYYWPPDVRYEETIDAFVRAFNTLGFRPCDSRALEPAFEKVAIYAAGSRPNHAARQLRSGIWTSKLGRGVDIEHTLAGLEGSTYGAVAVVLTRPFNLTVCPEV